MTVFGKSGSVAPSSDARRTCIREMIARLAAKNARRARSPGLLAVIKAERCPKRLAVERSSGARGQEMTAGIESEICSIVKK